MAKRYIIPDGSYKAPDSAPIVIPDGDYLEPGIGVPHLPQGIYQGVNITTPNLPSGEVTIQSPQYSIPGGNYTEPPVSYERPPDEVISAFVEYNISTGEIAPPNIPNFGFKDPKLQLPKNFSWDDLSKENLYSLLTIFYKNKALYLKFLDVLKGNTSGGAIDAIHIPLFPNTHLPTKVVETLPPDITNKITQRNTGGYTLPQEQSYIRDKHLDILRAFNRLPNIIFQAWVDGTLADSVEIPFIIEDFQYNTEATLSPIAVLGASFKKYHYTSSDDSLEFKLIHKWAISGPSMVEYISKLTSFTKPNSNGRLYTITITFSNVRAESFFTFSKDSKFYLEKVSSKVLRFSNRNISSSDRSQLDQYLLNQDYNTLESFGKGLGFDPVPEVVEQSITLKCISNPLSTYGRS